MRSCFFVVDHGDVDADTLIDRVRWGNSAVVQARSLGEDLGKEDDLSGEESLVVVVVVNGKDEGEAGRREPEVAESDVLGESLADVVNGAGDWQHCLAWAAKGLTNLDRRAVVDH
jgi:hypothetical protein